MATDLLNVKYPSSLLNMPVYASGSKRAVCKTVVYDFLGSNPSAGTLQLNHTYVVQRQETTVLETVQCGFESLRRYAKGPE